MTETPIPAEPEAELVPAEEMAYIMRVPYGRHTARMTVAVREEVEATPEEHAAPLIAVEVQPRAVRLRGTARISTGGRRPRRFLRPEERRERLSVVLRSAGRQMLDPMTDEWRYFSREEIDHMNHRHGYADNDATEDVEAAP